MNSTSNTINTDKTIKTKQLKIMRLIGLVIAIGSFLFIAFLLFTPNKGNINKNNNLLSAQKLSDISYTIISLNDSVNGIFTLSNNFNKDKNQKLLNKGNNLISSIDNKNSSIKNKWSDFKQNVLDFYKIKNNSQNTIKNVQVLNKQTHDILLSIAPLWKKVSIDSNYTAQQLVNFSLVLSQIQFIHSQTSEFLDTNNTRPSFLSKNILSSVNNIKNSFSVFSKTNMASKDTPLTQMWLSIINGFSRIKTDNLENSITLWNKYLIKLDNFNKETDFLQNKLLSSSQSLGSQSSTIQKTKYSHISKLITVVLLLLGMGGWLFFNQKLTKANLEEEKEKNLWFNREIKNIYNKLKAFHDDDFSQVPSLSSSEHAFKVLFSSLSPILSSLKEKMDLISDIQNKHKEEFTMVNSELGKSIDKLNNSMRGILNNGKNLDDIKVISDDYKKIDINDIISSFELEVNKQDKHLRSINDNDSHTMENIKTLSDLFSKNEKNFEERKNLLDSLKDIVEQVDVLSIQCQLQVKKTNNGDNFEIITNRLQLLSESFKKNIEHLTDSIYVGFQQSSQNKKLLESLMDKMISGVAMTKEIESGERLIVENINRLKDFDNQLSKSFNNHEKSCNLLKDSAEKEITDLEEVINNIEILQKTMKG